MDSGRVTIYLLWALGCVLFWGVVVVRDVRAIQKYPGSIRSRRELATDAALFATAGASAVSLVTVLAFGPEGQRDARSFALAFALGAFLAAGIIKATYGQRA